MSDPIVFTVEVNSSGGLCASAGSWGIYTQGGSPYELIGMVADAAQCMTGAADVDFEIVWPDEPPKPPQNAWPNVLAVSVRDKP